MQGDENAGAAFAQALKGGFYLRLLFDDRSCLISHFAGPLKRRARYHFNTHAAEIGIAVGEELLWQDD